MKNLLLIVAALLLLVLANGVTVNVAAPGGTVISEASCVNVAGGTLNCGDNNTTAPAEPPPVEDPPAFDPFNTLCFGLFMLVVLAVLGVSGLSMLAGAFREPEPV